VGKGKGGQEGSERERGDTGSSIFPSPAELNVSAGRGRNSISGGKIK